MNRIAVIVATPNCPGLDPLPGADDDIRAWKAFLETPEGGAWEENRGEVKVFKNPTMLEIESYLKTKASASLDYVLLTFSGHGEMVHTSQGLESRLYLDKTTYLTERTFSLNAQRELLILDACRQYRDERMHIMNKAAVNESIKSADLQSARHQEARKLFTDHVGTNPTGRSLVYSCEKNEIASDRPSFSGELISAGITQAKAERYKKVLAINEVFPTAKAAAAAFKQPQHAVYEGGRRITHLPFSVSL